LTDKQTDKKRKISFKWIYGGFPFYNFRKNALLWLILSLTGGIIGFTSSIVEEKTKPLFKYEFVQRKGWSIKYTKRKSGIDRLKKIKSIEDKAGINYNGGSPRLVYTIYNKSILGVKIIDTVDTEFVKFRAISKGLNNTESRFTGYTYISNICLNCNSAD